MKLVLFDVDGTILSAQGAGRRALSRALEQVYGTVGALAGYDFRGRTDLSIVLELMCGAGLGADAGQRQHGDGRNECVSGDDRASHPPSSSACSRSPSPSRRRWCAAR